MKKIFVIILWSLFATETAQAQDALLIQAKKPIQFTTYQMLSLNYDGNEMSLQGHLSAGVRRNKMSYMLGSSYTANPYRYIATYADVRWDLGNNQRFYAMAKAGLTNLLDQDFSPYIEGVYREPFDNNHQNKLGLYGAGGVGATAKIGKEVKYNVALQYGYSSLRMSKDYLLPNNQLQDAFMTFKQLQWGVALGLSF